MAGLLEANQQLKRQTRDIFGQLARTEQQREITNSQLAAQEQAASYQAAGTGAGLGMSYGPQIAAKLGGAAPGAASTAAGTTLESAGLNATSALTGDLALAGTTGATTAGTAGGLGAMRCCFVGVFGI